MKSRVTWVSWIFSPSGAAMKWEPTARGDLSPPSRGAFGTCQNPSRHFHSLASPGLKVKVSSPAAIILRSGCKCGLHGSASTAPRLANPRTGIKASRTRNNSPAGRSRHCARASVTRAQARRSTARCMPSLISRAPFFLTATSEAEHCRKFSSDKMHAGQAGRAHSSPPLPPVKKRPVRQTKVANPIAKQQSIEYQRIRHWKA